MSKKLFDFENVSSILVQSGGISVSEDMGCYFEINFCC